MENKIQKTNRYTLVADIGGTNARFALVEDRSRTIEYLSEYRCKDFANIDKAIAAYISSLGEFTPHRICLAVPGPVEQDSIRLVNSHWHFSQRQLAEDIELPIKCVNDFDAQAYYVNGIEDDELDYLDWPEQFDDAKNSTRLVIGAGTGLGVSAILPSGELVQSEAGHMAFAPLSEHQAKLLASVQSKFSRVSVERFLSGPGLENLYWANSVVSENRSLELSAPEVVNAALRGDRLAARSVGDFFDILAAVSGDLTLAMGAWSGVYISGGVVPRLLPFLNRSQFRKEFSNKGRFKKLCQKTPIAFVMADNPGLKGCAMVK